MSRVWLRHIKQQDYYPAKASRWRHLGGYSC
jgi:type IV secretion system protein VirB3/type IV secretion system protein VirB4